MTTFPAHIVKPDHRGVERLAMTMAETARAMGISERHFQAGLKSGAIDIPNFRIGRCRLFPVEQVRRWLQVKCEGAQ